MSCTPDWALRGSPVTGRSPPKAASHMDLPTHLLQLNLISSVISAWAQHRSAPRPGVFPRRRRASPAALPDSALLPPGSALATIALREPWHPRGTSRWLRSIVGNVETPAFAGVSGIAGAGFEPATFGLEVVRVRFVERSQACLGTSRPRTTDPTPPALRPILIRPHARSLGHGRFRRAIANGRSGGRCVGREDRAPARHVAVDESQRPERPVVAEDPLAATEDDRVDHQPQLVDEAFLEQCPHEL